MPLTSTGINLLRHAFDNSWIDVTAQGTPATYASDIEFRTYQLVTNIAVPPPGGSAQTDVRSRILAPNVAGANNSGDNTHETNEIFVLNCYEVGQDGRLHPVAYVYLTQYLIAGQTVPMGGMRIADNFVTSVMMVNGINNGPPIVPDRSRSLLGGWIHEVTRDGVLVGTPAGVALRDVDAVLSQDPDPFPGGPDPVSLKVQPSELPRGTWSMDSVHWPDHCNFL